ncbi:hypothetical protein OCU04_006053 [Sclerotinia nivalis]|uniref:Uncharacterized protein n=1 Tax=Sclerotinia nivalis TaxID=352851 RepID=A0A9X0AMF6_9HELO|nr:hypothetical protein OCU04_006053 [Sclerotinia nivalis]
MDQNSRHEDHEARAIGEEQDNKTIEDFWHAYHASRKKRDIFDEMNKALPLEILVPKRKSSSTQLEEMEEVVNPYYLGILTGKKSSASRWRNEGRENFDSTMKCLNALFEELPRALEESEKSRLSSMETELRELFKKSSADPGLGAEINVWICGHSERSRALHKLLLIKIVDPFSSKTGDVAITDRLETIYPGLKKAYLEEMMYLYGRDNSWFMRVDLEAVERHLSLIRDNISRLDE